MGSGRVGLAVSDQDDRRAADDALEGPWVQLRQVVGL
jgi:hypothetical protein